MTGCPRLPSADSLIIFNWAILELLQFSSAVGNPPPDQGMNASLEEGLNGPRLFIADWES